MGTRSNIYIETEPETYLGTYCHYDGYPEHMFPTLSHMNNDKLLGHILTAMTQGGLRVLHADHDTLNSTEYLGDYSCTCLLTDPLTDDHYGEYVYVKKADGKVMWRGYSESKWSFEE